MDSETVVVALSQVRWDAPGGALAQQLAVVLGRHCRAMAVELSLGESTATQVDLTEATPASRSVRSARGLSEELSTRRSWGSSRLDRTGVKLGATRRWIAPLPCRHTAAYLVVWMRRTSRGASIPSQQFESIRGVVGLLVDAHVLLHRVAALSRHAHSDNRRLRRDLRRSLGFAHETRSPAMQRCLERAQAVARYDTPVLITGPSGAGKELIARRIHALSPRSGGPLEQLNCGAIPEGLIESELFGHERGAFTGAVSMHRGVFERAAGGTLLLDEVGELSPSAQVKLLRVLQEGTFARVGSEGMLRTDARVIAATHRDLAALTSQGVFRQDLFYRLAVFEVQVPSLRERTEDLPSLVQELTERIASRMGRPAPSVGAEALAQLAAYDWPGNVRELENRLEAALVMSSADELRLRLPVSSPAPAAVADSIEPLERSIRRCIEAALASTRGKIYGPDGAAQRLGLPPGTLQSKMRKLGIDRKAFV